ncbi:MAG TPA: DUF6799 domain-containing protein [Bacteroidia bacterium]|nr:DUF6799 domain-containing protein [Bacteroidia bacterium]
MKTIRIWVTASILATGILFGCEGFPAAEAAAGEVNENPDMYCAKMKDGQLVVMYQAKEITSDVFLTNGTTVKRDGTLIKKDGTRSALKEGECIDMNGKTSDERAKQPY